MNKVHNTYLKQGPRGQISGCQLAEVVVNTHFTNCDFHPNTFDLKYEGCIFENCDVYAYDLSRANNCSFIN